MIDTITTELGISTTIAWLLIGLVVVQLVLQIWSLVDLARRPRVRFGMKWLWALIIIFGGNMLLGPIVYLAFGRTVPEEIDLDKSPASGGNGDRTRRAVDTLYGEEDGR